MEKPTKPADLDAPGLVWKARASHWVGYWVARQDIVSRGYPTKSLRLCSSENPIEWPAVALQCVSLQREMLAWAWGGDRRDARSIFNGTMATLIEVYQTDGDSPFHNLRHHTRNSYGSKLNTIVAAIGDARLSVLTFRDFKRWHAGFGANGEHLARAHGLMTMVRIVIGFGALLELPDCQRLATVLKGMEFPMPRKRTDFLTAGQVVAIRRQAHAMGFPSIALAQALQFELMLRQKDVIGEWLPLSEPGVSDVAIYGQKWMNGLTWAMVDESLTLRKTISKSLKGRKAMQGKELTFNLRSYPMVMEELTYKSTGDGPLILCEYTGIPWRMKPFQAKWRAVARAAGIPDAVQNRDSRAGGITEATDAAGQDFELVRRHAGHSQPSMTARYSRDHVSANDDLAARRAAKRKS